MKSVSRISRSILEFCSSPPYRNVVLNHIERRYPLPWRYSIPIVLQIEATNACNLSCKTCGHSWWDSKKNRPRILEPSKIDAFADWLPRMSEVQVGGYGEPTLHPDLTGIFDRVLAFNPHLHCRLITNLTRMSALREVLGKLHTVIVSLDGVNEVYEDRRQYPFQKIESNLLELEASNHDFEIEINLVWNRVTHRDLFDVVSFLKRFSKVSRLNLLPEKMYGSSRQAESLFQPENLHQMLMDLNGLRRTTDIVIQSPDLLQWPLQCSQPYETVFLLSDAEVMACCSAIFRGHEHRFSLGQLDQGLDALQSGPELQQFRWAWKGKGEFPSPCQDCAFRFLGEEQLRRWL